MFTFVAIYKDGKSYLYDPKNYNIAHVDKDKLDKFQIKDAGSDIPLIQIHFDDPRKRLIYVRRTEMHSTLPHPIICHLVGWQMKVGGENIQCINYVFETVIVSHETHGDKRVEVQKHMHWIEQAGKYDRERDSRFFEPSAKQLSIIGSNPS